MSRATSGVGRGAVRTAAVALLLAAAGLAGCSSTPDAADAAGQSAATAGSQSDTAASGGAGGSPGGDVGADPQAEDPDEGSGEAPGGGTVDQVVEAAPESAVEVPLDQSVPLAADQAGRLEASVAGVRAVEAQASMAGEVSGPALAVTIDLSNGTSAPVDLSRVSVDLTDSQGTPAGGFTTEPAQWFEGTLKPGASTQAVYVFGVDPERRDPISVRVTVGGAVTEAVFTGAAD